MAEAPIMTSWGDEGAAIPSLELISSRGSRWAHRVLIALEEAHLPYKLTEVDLTNKPDWLFKANPQGLVPILGVGTPPVYLTESANIVSYITEHTPSIQPSTDLERARAARIAEVAVDLLAGEISPDLIPVIIAPLSEDERESYWNRSLGIVGTVQGLLDPEGPFALGQRFTETDILIAPLVGRLWAYGNHALIPAGNLLTRLIEEDAKYARFLKYVKAISERESWKKTWDEEFSISRLEKKIAQYKASQDKS
ncbi:hypothetical protein B9479_004250 [Cryptococcus floricola]|uniref:GST N-terminal domain-containing protein n=1 Tax=Cryptococcus floricola TaxID=2591691 RepID=A0A5D3AW70_9TREE|nr:hypothetical protein B9479_004250 [Cryptococcus floricola]